jgi:GH15 family glucan-1,4-alpha-glucosidase
LRDRLLADGPALKPAYTVDGDDVPDQRCLDLPGYPGGTDVVGNQANVQFQLDAFGEPLLLFAAAARHDRLDSDGWRAVEVAADAIERRWRDIDAGLWEIEQKAWTHSRLICVAGLRAVAALPRSRRVRDRWLSLAEAILADTSANALHPDGRWQRAADDPRPDASLLLAALRGAVPPDDVRSVTTLEAIDAELTDDCFCYRYRPDERPLGSAEGAFLLCGFMMSLARLQQGDRVAAARWFERNRTACGPPGLLAEEFDVEQRQLRGNLPQAFVHALLLECAVRLSQDRES